MPSRFDRDHASNAHSRKVPFGDIRLKTDRVYLRCPKYRLAGAYQYAGTEKPLRDDPVDGRTNDGVPLLCDRGGFIRARRRDGARCPGDFLPSHGYSGVGRPNVRVVRDKLGLCHLDARRGGLHSGLRLT